MIKQLTSTFFAFCLIAMAHSASATLISYNGYSHDDTTDIVTGGGLEWLQWDVTDEMSIDTALTSVAGSYAGGGWRLASNVEMATLLNAFDFGISSTPDGSWDSDENTFQEAFNYGDPNMPQPPDPETLFLSMFGITQVYTDTTNPDGLYVSGAYFGADEDNDNTFNTVLTADNFYNNDSYVDGYAAMDMDGNAPSLSLELFGVALVREAVSVPEPHTGLLFLISLILIISINQNKAKANRHHAY